MPDEPARELTVEVAAAPDPHRIRVAIADALAGRAVGAGPEAQVARVVADAVRRSTVEGRS
ncbi:MAG TPA: hypothetical protein VK453_03770 [Micromonosporaceae bacterium]|nr:hypothetical protein [Micromonosporaceae bacterium]